MPWGYWVPVWKMPLGEETSTKIWETASQNTSQDHDGGVLRPPMARYPRGLLRRPTSALCPCHPSDDTSQLVLPFGVQKLSPNFECFTERLI